MSIIQGHVTWREHARLKIIAGNPPKPFLTLYMDGNPLYPDTLDEGDLVEIEIRKVGQLPKKLKKS